MTRSSRRGRSLGVCPVLAPVLVAGCLFATAGTAAGQSHAWSRYFGGSSNDYGEGVARDASGNVVVTGYFRNTVDFGGGPMTSAGDYDIFLAKYDALGNYLWSRRFGGASPDYAFDIATDAAGNIVITGEFAGTVNFGGSNLTAQLSDIFVASFDGNGNHRWSKRFGGTNFDHGASLDVDASGAIVVTGRFRNTSDFGGGPLTSAGNYDIFLLKLDAAGNHLWSRRFGNANYDQGSSVAFDGAGNVVVTGRFQLTVDFGGGPLVGAGNDDMFVAKYDGAGNHVWSARFGTADWSEGLAVDADGYGNVTVAGIFGGTLDVGGGALISNGGYDIVVAKFAPDGTHTWSRSFGSIYDDRVSDLATDGSIILTGMFYGTIDFGGGPLTAVGADLDAFLVKLDAGGNHRWSRRYGGTGDDGGSAIAWDLQGNTYLTGFFADSIDFGGGPHAGSGVVDVFLVRLFGTPVATVVGRIVRQNGTEVPTAGNILVGCPAGLDALRLEVDLDDASFDLAVASGRFTMSAPLAGNFTLWATHPSQWFADHDARPGNGYVTTFTRPFISGCGADEVVAYLDGREIGRVTAEVRSVDMVGNDHSVSLGDFSEFSTHYNSCQGGPGNYSPCSDFNADGCVSLADFSLFSAHYNHNLFPAKASNGGEPGTGTIDQVDLERLIALVRTGRPALAQNAPNPFNPRTEIRFFTPANARVCLRVFDVRGRVVRTLLDEDRPAGSQVVTWDGRDDQGLAVGSGVYFYRIESGGFVDTKRMMLVR